MGDHLRGSEQVRRLLFTSAWSPSKWDGSGNSHGGGRHYVSRTEKKPFGFSHCWVILNGKPKWTQLVADLKAGKEMNDGSTSYQSIGLDKEEEDVVVENGRATVPKYNLQVMGNKWEKARASRDTAATKMSSTWKGTFSVRENKKDERYKLMLDAQKERMDWDRERANKKLQIEMEKIELEKKEAAIKWELEKAKTFGEIVLEKERLQIAPDAEDVNIMLADESLLDEHAKKWLVGMKKEINERREYEAVRAAMAAVAEEARMQAEQVKQEARIAAEQAAWMASGE